MKVENVRPLFPPMVYAKICTVPTTLEANSLRLIIAEALGIDEGKIDVYEKALGGYNCIWEERESISFSELRWLSEPIQPFLVVSRRIASLTEPVTHDTRLLGVVSISNAAVAYLLEAIREQLHRSDIRTGDVKFQLSREKLRLMPDRTLLGVFSASVRHAKHETISYAYHRLSPSQSASHIRSFLEGIARPGDEVSVGITVDGIPVTVDGNQITVHKIDMDFEIIPAVLRNVFNVLQGEME